MTNYGDLQQQIALLVRENARLQQEIDDLRHKHIMKRIQPLPVNLSPAPAKSKRKAKQVPEPEIDPSTLSPEALLAWVRANPHQVRYLAR